MFVLRRNQNVLVDEAEESSRFARVGARFVLSAVVALGAVYATAPYFAVWRVAEALKQGDEKTLETSVDWESVREGLKEDVADGITGVVESDDVSAPAQAESDQLPPFGASFVKGIAGGVINREVIPQHFSNVFQKMQPGEGSLASFIFNDVQYAFFDDLDHFRLSVHCPGQEAGDAPIQVEMALQDYAWKVVRVRVPGTIPGLAPKRT